ncbi:MAG: hypothetical protein O2985_13290 [Proteobacteria bacterium]|nr:hypothetical protein [Pseudomonadota bacterium]
MNHFSPLDCWFAQSYSITRAYGCTLAEADGIEDPRTAFQKAVHVLGPIRAFKSGGVWRLDQKPAEPAKFIEAAQSQINARNQRIAKEE